MADGHSGSHWLNKYASSEYQWQSAEVDGRTTYYRPLGLVEATFDADGRHYEGRADISTDLELKVFCKVDQQQLREKIALAWTALRSEHLLLQARSVPLSDVLGDGQPPAADLYFAVTAQRTADEARLEAAKHLVLLNDAYESINENDFWIHCLNTSRVIDPSKAMAEMFVYPLQPISRGHSVLRFLMIGGHQIMDGLSSYVWMRDFVQLLNLTVPQLHERLADSLEPISLKGRLPLPQEALYPPIIGSRARRRWFWLLTRILRHVRKPLPAGFQNPLRRSERQQAVCPSPVYTSVLNYTKTPPLNTRSASVRVPLRNTQRLHRLCREAKASIGAGCFALAALVMMEMYEKQFPDIPLAERKPFISGFPLNPRAFFNHHTDPNSLMLAFSDGIALPFLPSYLDLDGRIRLLVRQAHRQLSAYQKRARPAGEDAMQYMGSRGAGRILANQYIASIERSDMILPSHLRNHPNPQGAYPMRPNHSQQTCGVSSVGRRDAIIKQGMYDVDDESKDFVADFQNISANVRARDGEFLVGIGGSENGLFASASVDACAMDPQLIEQWQIRLEHILDSPDEAEKARL